MELIDGKEILELVAAARGLVLDHEAAGHVKVKGRSDYVTQVDFRVQEFFQRELKERYPDIQFLGEEEKVQVDFERPCWILDPVDGTANLIHDLRLSAISLALYDGEDIVFGVVSNPFTGETFYAAKGEGSYLNGRPIRVSETKKMENAIISTGTSPYRRDLADENFAIFRRIFDACSDIRRFGSAAIDLAYVACGRLDGYVERDLKPWDFAAGVLLVQEAGGRISGFTGGPVSVRGNMDLAASNGLLNGELIGLLG